MRLDEVRDVRLEPARDHRRPDDYPGIVGKHETDGDRPSTTSASPPPSLMIWAIFPAIFVVYPLVVPYTISTFIGTLRSRIAFANVLVDAGQIGHGGCLGNGRAHPQLQQAEGDVRVNSQ